MTHTSRKMADVAALPMKLNLQLFADDDFDYDDESGGEQEQQEQNNSEVVDGEGEGTEQAGKPDVADPEQDKPRQDPETNRKFQEMRKQVEAAEKEAARAKKADDVVAKNWGHLGITTVEQLERHLEEEEWRAKGLEPDEVQKLIDEKLNNHPEVVASRQREREAFQTRQIEQLNSKYNLGVKSPDDIRSLPNGEAMIQKILAGYEWDEAYLVTHQEHITQKTAERAKQATLNSQQSRSHLKTTQGGGDVDAFTMPADVLVGYRRMFAKELRSGKMTEKDFIAHYRKSNGK